MRRRAWRLVLAICAGPCLLPGAALAACLTEGPLPQLSLSDEGGRSESGRPLALDWQVPAPGPDCTGRLYLMLDAPPALRFAGDGFVALLPGDEGPFGLDAAADRLRLLLPLEGPGPWSGRIEASPYLIGPVRLSSRMIHATTTGEAMAETALAIDTAEGPSLALDILPGRPRLVAQEAAPAARPDSATISADGAYVLETYGETFRVTHAATGALVVQATGLAPRFSPTGRFLHWYPRGWEQEAYADQPARIIAEDFVLFDLLAEEVVLRLADLPPKGVNLIEAVEWSPGDALMLLHRPGNCGMVLVQPLIAGRMVDEASGSNACDGPGQGIALATPALDGVALGAWDSYRMLPLTGPDPGEAGYAYLETPAEDGAFWLAGQVRSSYGAPEERLVKAQPLAADDPAAATMAVVASASRGAVPLDPVPLAARPGDRLAEALTERLAALDIQLAPAPIEAVWVETVIDSLLEPEGSGADFPFTFASGTQSGLSLPGEAESTLDALSARLIADTSICGYGFPPQARLWTLVRADRAVQILHMRCIVGTGALPEGMVAVLAAGAAGQGWSVILADKALDYQEPADGPGLAQRYGIPANVDSDWRLFPLAERLIALAAPPDALVFVDVGTGGAGVVNDADAGIEALSLLAPTADFTRLVQANSDGRVILRDMATGERTAEGAYLDDELVLADATGGFRWTAEGARHARVKFAGDPVAYDLSQLAPPGPDGSFALPPRLGLSAPAQPRAPLTLRAEAGQGLAAVEVYRDGLLVDSLALSGTAEEVTLDPDLLPETRALTLVARDALGARSQPLALTLPPDGAAPPQGRLFALAVGTNLYDDPAFGPLGQAVRDARRFAEAVSAAPPGRFATASVDVIADDPDLPETLPARLAGLAEGATPADTLFLHLSGHGFLGQDGAFYLAGPATRFADPQGTALPWLRLQSALARFPGRVVVFLDACHAGAVDVAPQAFASNDAALGNLTGAERIAVIAASKGRQQSLESPAAGGGFFTVSLVQTLADPDADSDGDGALDLTELYAGVKARTLALSDGRQTPWMMRNGLWGPVPLW